MIPIAELKRWLSTLPGTASIGVDEGGLCLITDIPPDPKTHEPPYLEIGGMSDDEDEETKETK